MKVILTEIVKRAMVYTLTSCGQITPEQKRELECAVRRGYLSKGKGGPFPIEKRVYAHPGFDFAADRARHYEEFVEWAHIDALRFNDERYELRPRGARVAA